MTEQAAFTLRGRNPDVLTCIANLSNDEVFTPPDLANRMLDTLADAWAASHGGADIWADSKVKFLDPCTKSGVFLREITRRLIKGLANEIPNLQARVDHILTQQVYGIAITRLTSLLARRSLYCSKFANGKHSVAKSFKTEAGNIWFERTEHDWDGEKCQFCGANRRDYDRGSSAESHAYAFTHSKDLENSLAGHFGGRMQFDVVIGNPPYQLGQSGGEAVGSFAMPIYQDFVTSAKSLEPRYIVFVMPSRWFAGGRGLDEFRGEMLSDRRIRVLVDFPESREVFAGVDIAGGISYFLWDSQWNGTCEVTAVRGGAAGRPMARHLNEYDILVRQNEAISILNRILDKAGRADFKSLAQRVAPIQPFSLRTKFRGSETNRGIAKPVVVYQSTGTAFMERDAVPRNAEWIDMWKVIVGRAVPAGGRPDKDGRYYGLIGVRVIPPGSVCTETYLVAGRFETEEQARRYSQYLKTRFVRFLVWLRTNTQDLYSERFAFVPDLAMDRVWTDDALYAEFGISDDEQRYIADMIRPIDEGEPAHEV